MKQNILNEITVTYQLEKSNRTKITSSKQAYCTSKRVYLHCNCQLQLKEYFFIILLNRNNVVIGYHKLSEGGISGTIADLRIAFAIALKCLASGIILVHNHPSGNMAPSQADKILTKKFKEAGAIMDIAILDHLIISETAYFSFIDEGEM